MGWTEQERDSTTTRRPCLELFVAGVSRRQIAIVIDVHRNTVNRWCSNPRFLAEARRLMDEHTVTTRIGRLRETDVFADRVARIARAQRTTMHAYAAPGSAAPGAQRRGFKLLKGGKGRG